MGGTKHERDVKAYSTLIPDINTFGEQYLSLSNDALRNKTVEFRQRIAEHLYGIDEEIKNVKQAAIAEEDLLRKEELFKDVDKLAKQRDEELEIMLRSLLPEAFAVMRETARRFTENETIIVSATEHDRTLAATKPYITIDGDNAIWRNRWIAGGTEIIWNMVHYDVQLIGGMVLHEGKIAEMATGEGKTLVSTLPSYLNGLSGQGVHIVTVNDYLAKRDSEWNGPIFEFLLLTVDCIDKYKPHSPERIKAYQSDIIYGTNNEFGFDYLRDNMVVSTAELVQRKHHFAMVDEVDSVLIDDARTPLIISGPIGHDAEEKEYTELKPRIEKLLEEQRKLATEYLTEARRLFKDNIVGVEEGEAGIALLRAHRALPKNRPLIKFLSEEGVKVLLQKTENFYMQEQSKRMKKVDMPLLFTIEEKNRAVELTEKGAEYLAQGSGDAQMFILPDIALRMMEIDSNTETTAAEKDEAKQRLSQEFTAKSRRLHAAQQLLKAYTLFEKDEEYVIIEEQVKIVDEQTGRIMEGRRYSDGLHQAIEAKENVKVGDATQTYATVTLQNYFRMYHKLAGMTGTAETEAQELWQIYKLDVVTIPTNRPGIRDDREDLVFKTAREKYNAVIEEIVNLTKQGRPVLVGTTSVDISEKLSRMLQMRGIEHNVLNAKQHQREADIVAYAGQAGNVTIATNMAGRGTDIKLGAGVKDAGGLAIIGTERHDSRRVDRQLRGRSGRQGDPGTSQFYVSLEDNLMRLFQSERIASVMDRMGHQDGEVIQHSMVTKSIERAQKKVEENNFGVRKRLLEYDDVMNIQREAIYKKRKNALFGERLALDLNTMFTSLAASIISEHRQAGNYATFRQTALETFAIDVDDKISEQEFANAPVATLTDKFQDWVLDHYAQKVDNINKLMFPMVQNIFQNEGHRYKRVALPFTDGIKSITVGVDLKEGTESGGKTIMRDIEKTITLALIDEQWKEHLRNMDELKDSVQGASFEQKDPLVIYKMEAYNLFENLIYKINTEVVSFLSKGTVPIQVQEAPQQIQEARERRTDFSQAQTNREPETETQRAARQAAENISSTSSSVKAPVVRTHPKVGRNEPCPCGSGKKYKNCHGAMEN